MRLTPHSCICEAESGAGLRQLAPCLLKSATSHGPWSPQGCFTVNDWIHQARIGYWSPVETPGISGLRPAARQASRPRAASLKPSWMFPRSEHLYPRQQSCLGQEAFVSMCVAMAAIEGSLWRICLKELAPIRSKPTA